MKKLLLVGVLFFALISTGFSETKELFSINEDQINTELAQLTELENYLATNSSSLADLVAENNVLIANISGNTNGIMGISSFGEPPLGIPSFIWGFCLGVAGLAVVYFVAEDKAETKKALWGCVTWGIIYTVFYVVYVAVVVSETTTTTY